MVRLKKYADFEPENYLEKLTVGTTEYTLKNQNPAVPAPPETEEEAETAPEAENREIEVRTYTKRYVEPSLNEDPYVRIVNVEMDSDVNTSIPGVYSVAYTVTMDGNYVGFTRLNVVVEE